MEDAMLAMSRAIREAFLGFGTKLGDIADDDLHAFVIVTSAFAQDFLAEEKRRAAKVSA